jgi:hypothetical protein
MSLSLQIGTSIIVAAVLAAICFRMMMYRRLWGEIHNGPWRIDPWLGSHRAGVYTRAFTARNRTYALQAPETVYCTAFRDSSGQTLHGGSTYRIEGREPDARWWSLTVYKHNHLIPNALSRYSFSKTTVAG